MDDDMDEPRLQRLCSDLACALLKTVSKLYPMDSAHLDLQLLPGGSLHNDTEIANEFRATADLIGQLGIPRGIKTALLVECVRRTQALLRAQTIYELQNGLGLHAPMDNNEPLRRRRINELVGHMLRLVEPVPSFGLDTAKFTRYWLPFSSRDPTVGAALVEANLWVWSDDQIVEYIATSTEFIQWTTQVIRRLVSAREEDSNFIQWTAQYVYIMDPGPEEDLL